MNGATGRVPLYDRRRLEQMVMEQRLRALLSTRKNHRRGTAVMESKATLR